MIINLQFPAWSDSFPFIGLSVAWLFYSARWCDDPTGKSCRKCEGKHLPLVTGVMRHVNAGEKLPNASWQTALSLGFISAVFDNIPLTALALKQGGYDWGILAYTVGFGGSMVWFGSSAGVAISNLYPESKSVVLWLKHGWHVTVAYIVGFGALLIVLGWQPHTPHKAAPARPTPVALQVH